MSGNNNISVNAAYISTWKQKNPKLFDIYTNGHYLVYKNQKVDISNIYMQDILRNPHIFYHIDSIESELLFKIIQVHTYSMLIKEKQLKEKVRRYSEYGYTTS